MRKKEIKIQTQNRDIALANAVSSLPQIFTGLSFYINGNTHPPMEDLRKMILQRGGEVRPVLRSKGMVKFIIAPMLTQMKFKQFQNYRVVREAWITESCEAGKLLDWSRWKLTVQGGWEEEGRKGLEGFFVGKPSQVSQSVKAERTEADPVEEIEGEAQAQSMLDVDTARQEEVQPKETAKAKAHTASAGTSPVPSAPVTPTRAPSAATQALLTPMRAPSIPISPGHTRADTPGKEQTPTKVQRPEGAWEHYYTKQSNEDAARLMKNQEWRLRNTAERGNEGGFIDGYYQNSRYVTTHLLELIVGCTTCRRGRPSSRFWWLRLNANPRSSLLMVLPQPPSLPYLSPRLPCPVQRPQQLRPASASSSTSTLIVSSCHAV
jgi:DNA repair protein REV1